MRSRPLSSSKRLAQGVSRRTFVRGLTVGGAALTLGHWSSSVFAQEGNRRAPWTELSGADFDLRIGETPMNFTGNPRVAFTVNGSVPAPTLRWKEGDTVVLRVANTLDEDASIHWHGIRLTGMPAWGNGTPEGERESWGLVHFIRRLPKLTPEDIERMEGLNPKSPAEFKEQQEIRRFLQGDPPPAPAEHKKKHKS